LAAQFWIFLIKEQSALDDEARLIRWKRVFRRDRELSGAFQDLLPGEYRKRFIESCLKLVLTETDLDFSDKEATKWWWDSDKIRKHNKVSEVPKGVYFTRDSHFNLFFSIKEFAFGFPGTELEAARGIISLCIDQILYFESQWVTESKNTFSKTRELFEQCLDKPFLLWEFSYVLKNHYPEALPYLLIDSKTAAWGMWLLEDIQYLPSLSDTKYKVENNLRNRQLISDIWLQGFELILQNIAQKRQFEEQSDVLFDVLYFISYNSSEKIISERISIANEYNNRYLKAIELLQNFRLDNYHIKDSLLQPYLFPYLIERFAERINSGSIALRRNEMKEFDVGIWQLYVLILKLCDTPFVTGEIEEGKKEDLRKLSKKTARLIVKFLKKEFSETEVTTYDYLNGEPTNRSVRWWSEPRALIQIDWAFLTQKLKEYRLLNRFINAYEFEIPDRNDIIQSNTEKEVEEAFWMSEFGQSEIKKYRIFLRVLLLMHEAVVTNQSQFLVARLNLIDICLELENMIINVSLHNKFSEEEETVDIFHPLFENSSYNSYGENLLSHLFKTAYFFSDSSRENLIKVFIDSRLDRLLQLYNFLSNPSEKEEIKTAIDKAEVEIFLKQTRWVKIYKDALVQAINSSLNTTIAEKILKYLKVELKKFVGFEPVNKFFIFQVEALIILKKNGLKLPQRIKQLDELIIPKDTISSNNPESDYLKFKKQIIAAIYSHNENLQKAIEIFEELAKVDPDNAEFTAQLYIHRTDEALISNQPDKNMLEKAYLDWIEFERRMYKNKEHLSINKFENQINFCKAIRSHYRKLYIDFDFYIDKLSLDYKFNKSILTLIIKYYRESRREELANECLNEAKDYYQYFPENFGWIEDLGKELDKTAIREKMKNDYDRIFRQSATELILISPQKLTNNATTIKEYVLFHLVETATLVLDKIVSIVRGENRYNDIFVIILQSRLFYLSWAVLPEFPGGRSANTKINIKPGHRDWVIADSKGSYLSYFEALIWDKNKRNPYIKTHLTKLIDDAWAKYKKFINSLKFKERYQLISKIKEQPELAKNYGTQNMKIATTEYGSKEDPIIIYHLYLNMSFGRNDDDKK
jgi:hypothetical protein